MCGNMEIKVGVSNRHIHLCKSDLDKLFGVGYELTVRRVLSQSGDYACEEVVSLRNKDKIIENVRIIGPVRKYTQVELSRTDANYLDLNPPIRDSGDLSNSEDITIIGPKGEIFAKNSCIIAARHIHINSREYPNLNTGDIVSVRTKDSIIDNVHIKKADDYSLELHIDKDDSLRFGLGNGDIVTLE